MKGPARRKRAARYIDRGARGFFEAVAPVYHRSCRHRSGRCRCAACRSPPSRQPIRCGGSRIEATSFFALVRTHTIQGTFCDPFYGGNDNFVGWDLLGYPGVRTIVTADEQKMGITLKPNHKSAYDYAMFNKATARRHDKDHEDHGDPA
jgi:hypothetical protein